MSRINDFLSFSLFVCVFAMGLATITNGQQPKPDSYQARSAEYVREVAQAVERMKTPDQKTQVVLSFMKEHSNVDARLAASMQLRKLGAAAIPTICRQQDLDAPVRFESKSRFALGVVLFPKEDEESLRFAIVGDEKRPFDKQCLLALLHELQNPETNERAIFALGYCSLATNGAIAPELLKQSEGLKSEERTNLGDMLSLVSYKHVSRAFDDIDDCIQHKKITTDVLEKRQSADIAAVQSYKTALENVIFTARGIIAFLPQDETSGLKLKFIDKLSKPIEAEKPQDEERTRAIAIWTKAIEEVETKSPLKRIIMKKADALEVRILYLENLLTEPVIEKRSAIGFGGVEMLILKETAANAGRSAEQQAILADLKQALADYDKVIQLYFTGAEGLALSQLSEGERQLVRKHNLMRSKQLATPEKASDKTR